MVLVKPNLISGEIMTILDEAERFVIIICPFYRISKWYKLKSKFEKLKQNKIKIKFYVRSGETESLKEVNSLGYQPIEIQNLHCKIYMNEKTAIVSSMNLLLSSELNSLDIAYKTTTHDEYEEVSNFYRLYVEKLARDQEILQGRTVTDINDVCLKYLKDVLESNYIEINELCYERRLLIIKTKTSRYRISIKDQKVEMIASVSKDELAFGKINKSTFFVDGDVFIQYRDDTDGKTEIVGELKKEVLSMDISDIRKNERFIILKAIAQFVYSTENLRGYYLDVESSPD